MTGLATEPHPRPLDQWLASHGAELVAVRRQLHAHPELGNAEYETTELLRARLAEAGLAPRVVESGTGLICDVGSGDATVAIRADIDALPVQDRKEVPYRSTVDGVCHACGHDVHTAVALGAALALHGMPGRLPGRVRFVFQPAEELTPGGAIGIVRSGAVDGVRAIFALHCDPRLEAGRIGLRTGPITAAADTVEVRLSGQGGHTARPHLTADLVYALGRVIVDVPGLLSRLVDPRAGLSLVWGHASTAGRAANAIPQDGVLRGTVRMLDRGSWGRAPEVLTRLIHQVVAPTGVTAEVDYQRGVPPVVNEPGATALLRTGATEAVGADDVVDTPQSLGGEDFAWYLERVPGALARLGVGRAGAPVDLHQGTFDVDERAVAVGVRVFVHAAYAALTP